MGLEKHLDSLLEPDLIELISDGTPEGQTVEYKRAVNLETAEAKGEFLADISSFANASGGDIIFGMGEQDGKAKVLVPLSTFDPDRDKLKFAQLCAAHISPPIHGLRFKEIPVPTGGHALVARIPKTWNGPHMVTFNREFKFYIRVDNGKTLMTCPELRRAFLLSDTVAQRIKNFRLERLGNISAGETPVPLEKSACIVLHVLPLLSFEQDMEIDLKTIQGSEHALPMNYKAGGLHGPITFNFEGLLNVAVQQDQTALSYLQVFRNGCLEAVDAYTLEAVQGNGYFTDRYERVVIGALARYLQLLTQMAIDRPFFVCLSILGVKGFHFQVFASGSNTQRVISPNACQRNDLLLPEIYIEDQTEVVSSLKPAFDILWQTFGFQQCGNFDSAGKWCGGWLGD